MFILGGDWSEEVSNLMWYLTRHPGTDTSRPLFASVRANNLLAPSQPIWLRAIAIPQSVCPSVRLSVCPSVRPSVC